MGHTALSALMRGGSTQAALPFHKPSPPSSCVGAARRVLAACEFCELVVSQGTTVCLSGTEEQAMVQPGLAVSSQNMISETCKLEPEAKSRSVDAPLLADFCLSCLILP